MTQISSIQALEQQRVLLRLEYETEKEEFRQQTEERGVARLVKRGDVWLPLRVGNTFYNSLIDTVYAMHCNLIRNILMCYIIFTYLLT